jgi:hypothetical protein
MKINIEAKKGSPPFKTTSPKKYRFFTKGIV